MRERPPASSSPPSASWSSPTIASRDRLTVARVLHQTRAPRRTASIGAPWVNDDTSCSSCSSTARTVQVALSFHAAAVPNGRCRRLLSAAARPRPRSRPLHHGAARRRRPPTGCDGRRRRTPRARSRLAPSTTAGCCTKPRRRRDEPEHGEHPLDAIEVAQLGLQHARGRSARTTAPPRRLARPMDASGGARARPGCTSAPSWSRGSWPEVRARPPWTTTASRGSWGGYGPGRTIPRASRRSCTV